MSMHRMMILLSHRKIFLFVWSCEKFELSSTFCCKWEKPLYNQSSRVTCCF